MATVRSQIAEHDVVVLLDSAGRWPAGTVGAVVSDYGDVKLVEIADEHGVAMDYVQVPASQLERWTRQRPPFQTPHIHLPSER